MLNDLKGKRITLLAFSQSVVIRGIEKKIDEMEHIVTLITEKSELDGFENHINDTDLILFYLPEGSEHNTKQMKTLHHICEVVHESGTKMLLIGEKTTRPDLIQEIPEVSDYTWIDRPVNMDSLSEAVDNELLGTVSARPLEGIENPAKRVLIVDDDPQYAKMVREWLKDTYPTSVVTAGLQAITYLKKNHVDLILLDYEMPIVDGPQVLKILKSESEFADIPVVFLTGIGDRQSVQKVVSLHPDGYVLKSASREELIKYIGSVLKKY